MQDRFCDHSFRWVDRAWTLRGMYQSRPGIDTLKCHLCEKGHFSAGNTSVGRFWFRSISYCREYRSIVAGATDPESPAPVDRGSLPFYPAPTGIYCDGLRLVPGGVRRICPGHRAGYRDVYHGFVIYFPRVLPLERLTGQIPGLAAT